MGTQKDNTLRRNSVKKQSSSKNLMKLLGLLHKYLPNNFREVIILNDEKEIFRSKIDKALINIKFNHEGEIISKVDSKSLSEFSFGMNVLMHFLRQYNGDVTAEFEIAGLPWTFNLSAFVKRYAPLLYKKQMREILIAMNANKNTRRTYLKDFKKLFKDAECDRFMKKFFKLVKENNFQVVWDCDDKFPQNLGVTENQLLEWKREKILGKKIMLDESRSPIKLVYTDNEE